MLKEQESFTPEAQKPAERFLTCPPITAEQLLERKIEEPKRLKKPFASAPIYFVSEEFEGFTQHTGVIRYQMGRRELALLLYTTAPKPLGGPSIYPAREDWKLPQGTGLAKLHSEVLGEHWQTFEQNRITLLAISDESKYQPTRYENRQTFQQLLKLNYETRHLLLGHVRNCLIDTPLPVAEELKFLLQKTGRFKGRKWVKEQSPTQTLGQFTRLDTQDWNNREFYEKFLIEALGSSDLEVKQWMVNCYNSFPGKESVLTIEPDGSLAVVNDNVNAVIKFERDDKGQVAWNVDPEQFFTNRAVFPTIRWKEYNGGERVTVFDPLDENLLEYFNGIFNLPDKPAFNQLNFNPLVGFGMITYFQRELKKKLPKWQKFVKDEGGKWTVVPVKSPGPGVQFMGGQAVLIVNMQYQDEILKTDFFEKAQDFIKAHAA